MDSQLQSDLDDKLQNHLQISELNFVYHMKTLDLNSQQEKVLSEQYRNGLRRTVIYIFQMILEKPESIDLQSIQPPSS